MALTKLEFVNPTGWNDTIAFPENPDDSQVRPLLQQLHDETKAYLNNVLTAEIEGTMATKAELAGVVAGGIPDGTISVEMLDFDPTEQPEFDIHISDYVRNPGYALSTGSLNAYAIAVDPVITSYVDGMSFKVKWHLANTATSSLNVCGLGPITILDSKGNVLTADKLKTVSTVVYYNGNFILQGEGASGNAIASDLILGKTATTDAGEITGTLALTGDATVGDVANGKTFYNTNAKTILTGTNNPITAGTNIIASAANTKNVGTTTPTMAKTIQVLKSGTYRITFTLWVGTAGAYTALGRLYKNGVAIGTQRNTVQGSGSKETFVEDITLNAGDNLQLYLWVATSSNSWSDLLSVGINLANVTSD